MAKILGKNTTSKKPFLCIHASIIHSFSFMNYFKQSSFLYKPTEKLRHQTKLEEDSKSSSHQQSRQCLSMKSMPDLLSGSSGNFFRNNSGGPGANSGNGSCTGKSPSPPPDSLEDISYIDMEDDEMEEVGFIFDRELLYLSQ